MKLGSLEERLTTLQNGTVDLVLDGAPWGLRWRVQGGGLAGMPNLHLI